jgi:hypothetical protein
MNRRSLLRRAAQLLGGGALVAAGVLPTPPSVAVPAPKPPPEVILDHDGNAWRKTYQHNTYRMGFKVEQLCLEDDIYNVFAQRMGEINERQNEIIALNIFGGKP